MFRMTSAAVLLCVSIALGQEPNPKLTFEVASIKRAAAQAMARMRGSVNGGPGTPDRGRIRFIDMPLRVLIMRAYDVQSFQVSGPAWMDSQRFDVIANVPDGATNGRCPDHAPEPPRGTFQAEAAQKGSDTDRGNARRKRGWLSSRASLEGQAWPSENSRFLAYGIAWGVNGPLDWGKIRSGIHFPGSFDLGRSLLPGCRFAHRNCRFARISLNAFRENTALI